MLFARLSQRHNSILCELTLGWSTFHDAYGILRRWDLMPTEMNGVTDRLSDMFGVHVSLILSGPDPNAGGAIVTKQ